MPCWPRYLAAQARAREFGPQALTIAVTGSGGLIGTALTALLSTGGHHVIRLVRRPPRHAAERYWNPDDPAPDLLSGVEALIHLAGASIGGRFTAGRKQEIRDSRITPTGHHFRYPELEAVLRHVLGRESAVIPAIRMPTSAE
jgi:hypothetical protein